MRSKQTRYTLIMLICLAILLWVTLYKPQDLDPKEGFTAHQLVAHAMGGIDGLTYSNTYEAFVANYEKGIRVFEADLLLSQDDKLIARHEWGESFSVMLGQEEMMDAGAGGGVWTYEEFKNAKVMGLYEPLSWEDILGLMQQYPDMYLVTDTKQIEPEEIDRIFTEITETAERRNPELLKRIVPQIYYQSMWDDIEAIHPFESVIFTLYQTYDSDESVVAFAKEKGIAAITMSATRANASLVASLNELGIPSYVHTINDRDQVLKFKRMGVYGFYTDFLEEKDVESSSWLQYLGL